MNETDLAYIAGIIDGEGCITIAKLKTASRKRGFTYALQIRVANTNEWLIQWLRINFGGYIYYNDRHNRPEHKPIWAWIVTTQAASRFLKLILPYIRLKKPQAEIGIQLQSKKRRRGSTAKTDEEFAFEIKTYEAIREMNKTGREAN